MFTECGSKISFRLQIVIKEALSINDSFVNFIYSGKFLKAGLFSLNKRKNALRRWDDLFNRNDTQKRIPDNAINVKINRSSNVCTCDFLTAESLS
jgi:hypothetical protein